MSKIYPNLSTDYVKLNYLEHIFYFDLDSIQGPQFWNWVQSKQSGPWEMFKSQINSIQIEWSLKYKQSFYPRFWTPTSRNKLDAN